MKSIEADVSAMIMNELTKYSEKVAVDVNELSAKYAKKLRDEIKKNSPKKAGEYAKGWTVKQVYKKQDMSEYVVYNAKKPHLTHLLEKGHKVKGGTKRSKAFAHIAPAEQKILTEFQSEVEKIIKDGG